MPGPREWSPRGFKKYTIIGLWADNSLPWVEFAEGTSAADAVRHALTGAKSENNWDDEVMKNLFIVEVVEGHHQGLLWNEATISGFEFLTGQSGE